MHRLPFVIWLIGWPLACDLSDRMARSRQPWLERVLEIVLWAAIALLLWYDA